MVDSVRRFRLQSIPNTTTHLFSSRQDRIQRTTVRFAYLFDGVRRDRRMGVAGDASTASWSVPPQQNLSIYEYFPSINHGYTPAHRL